MSDCPQSHELERILAGPPDEQVLRRLEEHLNGCPSCRQRLATLTEVGTLVPHGPRSWPNRTSPSAALKEAMERLKVETPRDSVDAALGGRGVHVPLLRPSGRAGFLGRLGNYEVRRVIGRGGSGMVLEALDPLLKRTVAIKMLSPWTVLDEETKGRFLREAQAAASLAHENLVTIYAIEQVEGTPFLVLEYVAGESLDERLRREGKLPLAEVVRIGAEVARGLAAAHGRGLVHRDIKPANILLVEETNRAKITDFGLAKAAGEDGLTMTGTLLGTPAFMSPEQAMRKEPDERSDLFSLGAVLYLAATGVSPFRGESLFDTLDNVRRCQPQPLHQIDPALPDWFCELVHRLLAKEPQDRLGWSAAVAEVLERGGATATVIERPAELPTVRTRPGPEGNDRGKKRWWPVGVTAVALIGLGVAGIVRLGGVPNEPIASQDASAGASEALPPQPRSPDSGFFISGRDEAVTSLAAAIESARDGDVIEVQGDGPFLTPPLAIVGKRLTIRAASGSLPRILPENPLQPEAKPLLQSDSDLRLEGLEIQWSIEAITGISEAEMLARSIVTSTHGRLIVDHCRMVSERWNVCVGASCRNVAIRHSHLIDPSGAGVFWRPEAGGELDIEDCMIESRFGLSLLIDSISSGSIPGQIRISRTTQAGERSLQLLVQSPPRRPLVMKCDHTIFDAESLLLLAVQRTPRAKAFVKPDDLGATLRGLVDWRENSNLYRRGIDFVARPLPGRLGSVTSAGLQRLDQWLEVWKAHESQSIEGQIQFAPRSESARFAPLVLEAVEQATGSVPAAIGADAGQLGPGSAYQAWRISSAYDGSPAQMTLP